MPVSERRHRQWVAGDDELALFRSCHERGLHRGEFLVARVEPDLPAAETNDNWFPPEA
jgi:hypothetical protein